MAKTEKRHKPQRLPKEVTDAVAAAEDKKAVDITLLDLRKAAGFADYFLICSGTNARQIRAIADAIMEALASAGSKPAHVEGLRPIRMDPARLLRFHRAHLRARAARVLRPRATLGERGTGRLDADSPRQPRRQPAVSRQSVAVKRLPRHRPTLVVSARPRRTSSTDGASLTHRQPARWPHQQVRCSSNDMSSADRAEYWRLSAFCDAVLAVALSPACASCDRPLEHPTRWSGLRRAAGNRSSRSRRRCAIAAAIRFARGAPPSRRPNRARDAGAPSPSSARPRDRRLRRGASRHRSLVEIRRPPIVGRASRRLDARPRRRRSRGRRLRGTGAAAPPEAPRSADSIRPPISRGSCGFPVLRALRRSKPTATQTGLPAARRHQNVRDAFVATRAARALRGAVVVLVDDVCTTGATLEACARVLKDAGAAEVRAITAARVVGRPR